MKKSLKYKIVLAIVIIVCIMDVSFIFVNYVNYMNVNRNYTDSLAQTVANTCRLVVDGDSVTGYLDNRRRNTAYYEVWNKLIDYRNTSENVLQISVVNFRLSLVFHFQQMSISFGRLYHSKPFARLQANSCIFYFLYTFTILPVFL